MSTQTKGGLKFQRKDDNRHCTAMHKNQEEMFLNKNKYVVQYFEDELCTKPVLENGKHPKYLVDESKLNLNGLID